MEMMAVTTSGTTQKGGASFMVFSNMASSGLQKKALYTKGMK
jgi:hypothetical protein